MTLPLDGESGFIDHQDTQEEDAYGSTNIQTIEEEDSLPAETDAVSKDGGTIKFHLLELDLKLERGYTNTTTTEEENFSLLETSITLLD